MILIDTSVWIDFFRDEKRAPALPNLLLENKVKSHPWILGELMVGHLGPRRHKILSDLRFLPQLSTYELPALTNFIEKEKLFGTGLSFVDLQLLYAAIIEDCLVWTHDNAFHRATKRFGKDYRVA